MPYNNQTQCGFMLFWYFVFKHLVPCRDVYWCKVGFTTHEKQKVKETIKSGKGNNRFCLFITFVKNQFLVDFPVKRVVRQNNGTRNALCFIEELCCLELSITLRAPFTGNPVKFFFRAKAFDALLLDKVVRILSRTFFLVFS